MAEFLFESHTGVSTGHQELIDAYADAMRSGQPIDGLAVEALAVVNGLIEAATPEDILRYAVKGRGADFTALQLFEDPERDDMLRLHFYPGADSDGEYHSHSRTVISTVMAGTVINSEANVVDCTPEERQFDVWECQIVDDACVPRINPDLGAKLELLGDTEVRGVSTYDVPTDMFHKVAVDAAALTLCWFTRTGMNDAIKDGRIIKPRSATPQPIRSATVHDVAQMQAYVAQVC